MRYAFVLRNCSSKGRHLVASRNLAPGDLVLQVTLQRSANCYNAREEVSNSVGLVDLIIFCSTDYPGTPDHGGTFPVHFASLSWLQQAGLPQGSQVLRSFMEWCHLPFTKFTEVVIQVLFWISGAPAVFGRCVRMNVQSVQFTEQSAKYCKRLSASS